MPGTIKNIKTINQTTGEATSKLEPSYFDNAEEHWVWENIKGEAPLRGLRDLTEDELEKDKSFYKNFYNLWTHLKPLKRFRIVKKELREAKKEGLANSAVAKKILEFFEKEVERHKDELGGMKEILIESIPDLDMTNLDAEIQKVYEEDPKKFLDKLNSDSLIDGDAIFPEDFKLKIKKAIEELLNSGEDEKAGNILDQLDHLKDYYQEHYNNLNEDSVPSPESSETPAPSPNPDIEDVGDLDFTPKGAEETLANSDLTDDEILAVFEEPTEDVKAEIAEEVKVLEKPPQELSELTETLANAFAEQIKRENNKLPPVSDLWDIVNADIGEDDIVSKLKSLEAIDSTKYQEYYKESNLNKQGVTLLNMVQGRAFDILVGMKDEGFFSRIKRTYKMWQFKSWLESKTEEVLKYEEKHKKEIGKLKEKFQATLIHLDRNVSTLVNKKYPEELRKRLNLEIEDLTRIYTVELLRKQREIEGRVDEYYKNLKKSATSINTEDSIKIANITDKQMFNLVYSTFTERPSDFVIHKIVELKKKSKLNKTASDNRAFYSNLYKVLTH